MTVAPTCFDHDRLTFGCDLCIARVKWDQETARIAELPPRAVVVEVVVHVPDDGQDMNVEVLDCPSEMHTPLSLAAVGAIAEKVSDTTAITEIRWARA